MRRSIALLALVGAVSLALGASAFPAGLPGTGKTADRAAWLKILHVPASCEHDWQTTGPLGDGISTWSTASGSVLVAVDCFLGAYQGVAVYFLVDSPTKVTGPLTFAAYIDPGNGKPKLVRQQKVLGDAFFDRKKGILSIFDKARGIGDCGIFSTYTLSGSAFTLVETRARMACTGKPPYDPAKWPKLS